MKAPDLVKKISVQTVHGTIDKKDLFTKGEIPVMRVIGIASGVEAGTSNFGDWECLTGEFLAQNPKGEQFSSGKAFLPGAGHSLIAGRLAPEGNNGVEFVFDFFAVADKEGARVSATGYTYAVRPVIEQAAESRLSNLQKQVLALENKTAESDKKGAGKK